MYKINIYVYDDKKEKYQSVEAACEYGYGYGATQEEALANLKKIIDEKILSLQSMDWANPIQTNISDEE